MSSSSNKGGGFRNVPPPTGGKPASPYARFIPREELGEVASWKPGEFGGSGSFGGHNVGSGPAAAAAPAAPPPEPTPDEWRARVDAARQAGYQDGYRDGLVALESFKQTFAQQATSQVGALLDAFDRQLTALDADVADAVAKTAVQLARQVLRCELQQRPGLVARVAAEAVSAVMLSARQIVVHVHPQDLPLVAEGADEALAARGARLVADTSLQRGGVRVASDVGEIDARIATRWAQAAATLGSDVALDALDVPDAAEAQDAQGTDSAEAAR